MKCRGAATGHPTDALCLSKLLGCMAMRSEQKVTMPINNIGDSLVQNKVEVECALAGPLLLLLLLWISPRLCFHRDTEEENSKQSQSEEHASLCPRHLSRLLLTGQTLRHLKIFTFLSIVCFLSFFWEFAQVFLCSNVPCLPLFVERQCAEVLFGLSRALQAFSFS